jgi:histidine triad (HIT) family protein
MSDTIFSKIIAREIPADIVYEDNAVIGFRDINPQAPVHVLIATKRPIATLNDVSADDGALLGALLLAAKQVAADLGIADSGYRTVINCNQDGGQDVFHIHMHLLGGRPMGWPPG